MWGIWLSTFFFGGHVGKDEFGNSYYRIYRKKKSWHHERRWVLYKGLAEPSKVPSLWYSWLHHTVEKPPLNEAIQRFYPWEKHHLPNLTGTPYAHFPKEHFLRGGCESWVPEGLSSKVV